MNQWNVSTYYKKNVQEVEIWYQREGNGRVTVTNGFRFGEWTVDTTDDNPPVFEFTEVPGGNGKKDSINMLDCSYNNINSVDLVEMFDGGCWYDLEIEGLEEEEEERIRELVEEDGIWALEEEDNWLQSDTEWWIWGPIEIKNEAGDRVRIICADPEGNVVDFVEEQ